MVFLSFISRSFVCICALVAFLCMCTFGADSGLRQVLPQCPASFLMDAVVDHQGQLWVVAEEGGVWMLGADSWEAMHLKEGFPPTRNCYAIAQDKQGRIWIGTDNQGVVVWNGVSWRTYDQLSGLLGERVYDIQVSPTRGLVAVATSGGVSLYDPVNFTWDTLTRAEGLLEDQVESLAFSSHDDLYVAYQCAGISYAPAKSRYRVWMHAQAKWYWDPGQRMRQPAERSGTFFHSNLCNVISVQNDRLVWIGTNAGLLRRVNGKYLFLRGKDYQAKNKGLFGGLPKDYQPATSMVIDPVPDLLPEDYVTALLPTDEGLWIGFRQQGAALLDIQTMKIKKRALMSHSNVRARWVSAFVVRQGGILHAATNGGGMQPIGLVKEDCCPVVTDASMIPDHPKPMPYADGSECLKLEQAYRQRDTAVPPAVIYFHEDWSTQGDWCERYGMNNAMLCAMNAPISNMNYRFSRNFSLGGWMGPHRKKDDALRHWVHWVNQPQNRNVLFCPTSGTRTEAEWDDHGEAYASTFDGPDIWILIRVPEGRHLVSLYFYNPNGREGSNGHRDYLVEARKLVHPALPVEVLTKIKPVRQTKLPPDCVEKELSRQLGSPVLARCRVKDFSGSGVYKTFLVNGEGCYGFRVVRNHSMNTIINGVFLTGLDAHARKNRMVRTAYDRIKPAPPSLAHVSLRDIPREALSLWSLCQSWNQPGNRWVYQWKRCAFRAYTSLLRCPDKLDDLKTVWRWHLGYWLPADREQSTRILADTWASNQEGFIPYRSRDWTPHSPNVIPFSVEECEYMSSVGLEWKVFRNMDPGSLNVVEAKKIIHQYIKKEGSSKPRDEYKLSDPMYKWDGREGSVTDDGEADQGNAVVAPSYQDGRGKSEYQIGQ